MEYLSISMLLTSKDALSILFYLHIFFWLSSSIIVHMLDDFAKNVFIQNNVISVFTEQICTNFVIKKIEETKKAFYLKCVFKKMYDLINW